MRWGAVLAALVVLQSCASVEAAKTRIRSGKTPQSSRRQLFAGFMPLMIMRPLASLAVTEYFPPGEETAEFKNLDSKATEFKRKQLEYKKKWESLTNDIVAAKSDDDVVRALQGLRSAFRDTGKGFLPEGVSRDAFLRAVRRKERELEAKGEWQKPVRMEFLDLKMAIDKSQRPMQMGEGPSFG